MPTASPITTLRDELTLITTLVDLMKQEQQFLVVADTDGLDTITPTKSQLISQMAVLAGQRHQHLGGNGFAAGEDGMQAWIDSGADTQASALWLSLLQATRDAKELNRVNGMLITKQMTHNQTIINAMRTPTAGADAGTYGPSGQASTGGPSRRYVVG